MIDEEEIIASIALTKTALVGANTGKKLIDTIGSAKGIYSSLDKLKSSSLQIGTKLLDSLLSKTPKEEAEKEFQFVQEHNIQCIPYTSPTYPYRLKECNDAPPILFFKGNCDLTLIMSSVWWVHADLHNMDNSYVLIS